ncbi:MAG: hypothetical protein ACE5I1_19485 [bacterium]
MNDSPAPALPFREESMQIPEQTLSQCPGRILRKASIQIFRMNVNWQVVFCVQNPGKHEFTKRALYEHDGASPNATHGAPPRHRTLGVDLHCCESVN